ncbi:hypothetical protein P170DRAFT_201710 [Aspergillus steynii IBT 23096]|uniref:Uncharacterized protein n=1 Tax=Aspergillus steynii IBT 23096 TaxID=1392250 RepID=A0A2I2G519_9EURO|nr:uncharacterized protein P170DRAFT_201710 [Aspergillus steynii IBT 23096]PLB47970.1 hypothetical protein P170DRAFT_201710 [Aspergillus steynii IBT 23096]
MHAWHDVRSSYMYRNKYIHGIIGWMTGMIRTTPVIGSIAIPHNDRPETNTWRPRCLARGYAMSSARHKVRACVSRMMRYPISTCTCTCTCLCMLVGVSCRGQFGRSGGGWYFFSFLFSFLFLLLDLTGWGLTIYTICDL